MLSQSVDLDLDVNLNFNATVVVDGALAIGRACDRPIENHRGARRLVRIGAVSTTTSKVGFMFRFKSTSMSTSTNPSEAA